MSEIKVFTVTPNKNDPPTPPFVHLYLSSYTTDGDGKILLSPQLMSNEEIDYIIDDLIKQLEEARKKAKNELKRSKDK